AGLSGTGGGVFLSPILVLRQWALARTAAAVSALFILMNSIAGLAGNLSSTRQFPPYALWFLALAGAGGALGSYAGSRRLDPTVVKRVIAFVLVVAGVRLLLTM
ncbi:MAG TPA: TSUP family transporter, partial [Longimicrobiales bacterium]|nr:TSUP family transporter [Longimicrobiales bacterium]